MEVNLDLVKRPQDSVEQLSAKYSPVQKQRKNEPVKHVRVDPMIISTMTNEGADKDKQVLHQYLDMSNIVNSQLEAPDKSKSRPARKIDHDDYDDYIANSLAQT